MATIQNFLSISPVEKKKVLYYFAMPLCLMVIFGIFFWPTYLGGQTSYLVLAGESMLPSIKPGSLVVARVDGHYQEGDIIAFVDTVDDNKQVVHRIIDIENDRYITRGDNNARIDSYKVGQNDVIGRVIFVMPFVGYLIIFFGSPIGFMTNAVFLGAVLYFLYYRKRNVGKKIEERTLPLSNKEDPSQFKDNISA